MSLCYGAWALVNALVGCDAPRRFWVSAEPKIVYTPRLETASESVPGALSAIYSRAIQRYEQKEKGGPATAPDDAEDLHNDHNTPNLNIGEKADGIAMVWCSAGCEQDRVLDALEKLGVPPANLFPSR